MSLNIIIPMAGSGSRFKAAGYTLPKPLIDVRGKPMIAHVIENIRLPGATLHLIARTEDAKAHPAAFKKLAADYGCNFTYIEGLTEGAACTLLRVAHIIDNDTPMLIANSDQIVDYTMQSFIEDAQTRHLDGSILTFDDPSLNPKWSYAATGPDTLVTETREKVAISPHATVGIYWFAKGRYFVEAANAMIENNDRTNNEFYICPSYNYLVKRGLRIGIHPISQSQMHGIGTPEDLDAYLKAQI